MTERRRRILTSDEQSLWSHVTRHIQPLGRRPAPDEGPPAPSAKTEPVGPGPAEGPTKDAAAKAAKQMAKGPGSQTATAKPKVAEPSLPPIVPLERRLRQRLSRGTHAIDAVIDLHGMRQDEAHAALRGFLASAQARGHTVVLVVTGKGAGAAAGGGLFEERGVLRRSVPHWLRLPDLRGLVVGFEEAVAHHGGGGALYVRLRRRRMPGDAP